MMDGRSGILGRCKGIGSMGFNPWCRNADIKIATNHRAVLPRLHDAGGGWVTLEAQFGGVEVP
jgi:hypothetical protein